MSKESNPSNDSIETLQIASEINRALADLSKSLLVQTNLEKIAALVLECAQYLTHSKFGFVGRLDPQTGNLVSTTLTREVWDVCQAAGKEVVFKELTGLWGWALKNRLPVLTNDPAHDPRSTGTPKGHISISSLLAVPSVVGDMLFGEIAVANADHPYTDFDLGIVESVASLYALTIQRYRADEQLRKLSRAVEQSPVSIVITDINGAIEYVNPKFTQTTGYSFEEAIGQNPRILKSGDKSPADYKQLWNTITSGGEWRGEFCNRKKNQESYWEHASISPITDGQGVITHFVAVKEDITERKTVQAALHEGRENLRKAHEQLEATLNALPDLLLEVDANGTIYDYRAPHPGQLSPIPREFVGKTVREVFPQEAASIILGAVAEAAEQGYHHGGIYTLDTSSGHGWYELSIAAQGNPQAVDSHFIVLARDISGRMRAEEQLRLSLAEKEAMLREIHHRVGNNFQVIIALLDMQAEYTTETDTRQFLVELQGRARAMALVHEKLYQSNNLAQVDFDSYLRALIASIFIPSPNFCVNIQINASVPFLHIETAIPCGLIVHELVTNALKYAFPTKRPGPSSQTDVCEVQIGLQTRNEQYVLYVRDNGVGLPSDLDWRRPQKTLGLKLVNILARQLGGQLELDLHTGASFELTFASRKKKTWSW